MVLGAPNLQLNEVLSPLTLASQVALVVKNPPANAGAMRDLGSIPGSGRSPGKEHGNLFQCSCLGNPTDTGAWLGRVRHTDHAYTLNSPGRARVCVCVCVCVREDRDEFLSQPGSDTDLPSGIWKLAILGLATPTEKIIPTFSPLSSCQLH